MSGARGYGIGIDRVKRRNLVCYSLPVGTPLPAGTLPGGGTYAQAAGTSQTEETWVTSWTTGALKRIAFVAHTPKIGTAPSGLVGLRLRGTWKNYVRRSDDIAGWTPTGTSVGVADNVVSPDGATNADTLTDDDGAAYELMTATVDAIPTDTERYRLELFVKDTSSETHAAAINWSLTGGTPIARSERLNSNDGTSTGSGPSSPQAAFGGWWRWQGLIDANGTNTGANLGLYPAATTIPLPGSDTSAGQGPRAVYGCSITRGKLKRDYQPTPSGSGATCADCAATYPASRFVRGGRLRLRFRWSPAGAMGDYNTNFRLVDHGSETTYVEFSATDQKLRVVVAGGAAEVCAVPMWWPSASLYSTSHPVVEMDLEIGGGVATRIRYRYSTDAGVTWTLPFDPLGGTAGVAQAAIGASGSLGVLTGAAAGTVADGWLHEHEAILTAPAWALQWLPTDDASVKAHLRADSSYTLNASTLSAWVSQTATAISATQGTGANQPTLVASGVNGRPAIEFDGANDVLGLAGLSFAAADVLVIGALRPLTKTSSDATLFDSTTGRLLCVSDSVNTAPSGSVGWYDGAYKSAGVGLTMATAQIVAWDLRSGANGRVFVNGVQVGSTTTYTQKAVGGVTNIGADIDGINPYVGRIGDLIIATSPTDALRRLIEGYLSTKFGIAVT